MLNSSTLIPLSNSVLTVLSLYWSNSPYTVYVEAEIQYCISSVHLTDVSLNSDQLLMQSAALTSLSFIVCKSAIKINV